MNIQHSSRSDEWFTPKWLMEAIQEVIGPIELDPASSKEANIIVNAKRILTREDNGLRTSWGKATSIFINPPGGKEGKESKTGLFWNKLMQERDNGNFGHAIFLAFSIEALQTTQKYDKPIAGFPFCVPSKRIRFTLPDGSTPTAPSHSNMIVYVPGTINETDKFEAVFKQLGAVINTERKP